MNIVFISNYFNHHQRPFSDAMNELTKGGYRFIATSKMSEERCSMGWGADLSPQYVQEIFENENSFAECQKLIELADVVIIGSAPEALVQTRIAQGRLVLRYSERIFKAGYEYWKLPVRAIKSYITNKRYKNVYMLCASAFAAYDYSKMLAYKSKTYKWGYFTEVKHYDIDQLMRKKKKSSILWAGRLIGLKHPESSIQVAKKLKEAGYDFTLSIIGNGELEDDLKYLISENGLKDQVYMLGSMSPQDVRRRMEEAEIYLFTSDFNEGWGAVLNESMNSGCAVLASHEIGSVPFMVQNEKNGLIFESRNWNDLTQKVKYLLENSSKRVKIGKAAYETIVQEWNPQIAAQRLLLLIESILNDSISPFSDGPCSKADIIRNNWYINGWKSGKQ